MILRCSEAVETWLSDSTTQTFYATSPIRHRPLMASFFDTIEYHTTFRRFPRCLGLTHSSG